MAIIPLTQGKFAIVDNDEFERLNKYKWYFDRGNYYASRCFLDGNQRYVCTMQRFILGLKKGDKRQVDHKNHDGLDNRKINLRICNKSQNQMNRKPLKNNNTSGFKGVHLSQKGKKWEARIGLNYKKIHLGYFENKISAAKAYNNAAKKYFGKFAYLNKL
jgi:hypothetical protein